MLEVRPFSFRDRLFRELADRTGRYDGGCGDEEAAAVIRRIEEGGSDALHECAALPGSSPASRQQLRVSANELSAARKEVSEQFLTSLSLARVNARKYHEHQRRRGYVHDDGDGMRLMRQVRALRRIGICVGASFSSLLRYAVPAQVAGVGEIAVAAAPRPDGSIDPRILATAKILGLEEVYRMSGAHAVAALAFGTPPVPRVDKIVGPGTGLTQTAKRLLSGRVGSDAGLGIGELAIVADDGANARFIAGDFIAQAEHWGERPLLVLFTTDRLLAEAVRIEVGRLSESLPNRERVRDMLAGAGAIFVCRDLDTAMAAVNVLAPARLSLMTRSNEECLADVETAGAVFMGVWSAEAAGDCFAGINPFLPVSGCSRFQSGLGVDDFTREVSVVEYGPDRLLKTGRHLAILADEEGLPGHAGAIRERLELLKLTVD